MTYGQLMFTALAVGLVLGVLTCLTIDAYTWLKGRRH